MKQTNNTILTMKQQLKYRMRINDYYELLDLQKNCSIQDIKRSYKKLALRYHPDKNDHEGTKQVFNKISHAYSKLSNQSTKAEYDQKLKGNNFRYNRYGTNSKPFNSYKSQGGFNFYNFDKFQKQFQQRQRRQQQQKLRKQFQKQNEEMQKQFMKFFNNFFEARANKRPKQQQKPKPKQQYERNQQKQNIQKLKKRYEQQRRTKQKKQKILRQQNKKKQFILVFLSILVIFVVGPQILSLFSSKPLYSLNKTSYHQIQVKTPIFNFPFFVNEKYFLNQTSQQTKDKIDYIINNKNMQNLKKQCMAAQKQRKIYEDKAFRQKIGRNRDSYLKKAKNIDESSCNVLFQYATLYQTYIRNQL